MSAVKKPRAFVITNPMIAENRSSEVTLSKFLRVIKPCYDTLAVIGGNLSVEPDLNDVELVSFEINRSANKIKRLMDIIKVQLKMCSAVRREIESGDQVFFWIGDKMLLPYHAARSRKAQINYFIMGNVSKEGAASKFTLLSSKLIRHMAANADYVCMESKSVIDEWPGLVAKKTRVLHLYTDGIEMSPIENREKVLGMVCRLTAGKHVLECIEAMSRIHSIHPEWKLEVIGSGKQKAECEALIEELKAKEYVSLIGWVEHNEIFERANKWKYLLFPTDTEGVPNGLIEMMGRGLPALASPVGGVKDIVRDGVNGFVLQEPSAELIAQGILRMIDQEGESYKKLCEEANRTIFAEFSLTKAIDRARRELC